MKAAADCRYFVGEKPCKYKLPCSSKCPHYAPVKNHVLIIKLGALGDVVRTTPILRALKNADPDIHISWLTLENAVDLLDTPMIDQLYTLNWQDVEILKAQHFQALYCLDKDRIATSLAISLSSDLKLGFCMNSIGKLEVFNTEAQYAFSLGIDDDLKFNLNRRTYQDVLFDLCRLDYKRQEYVLPDPDENVSLLGNKGKYIGINIGCGHKFKTKDWGLEKYRELIELLLDQNYCPVLLAGPDEKEFYLELQEKYQKHSSVVFPGYQNSLKTFMSIIRQCDLVVSSDTLSLHLALGMQRKVVALFGSTAPWEIDLYERGLSIYKNLECAPCYKRKCSHHSCMNDIPAQEVLVSIKALLD